jgi:hypothetical protein
MVTLADAGEVVASAAADVAAVPSEEEDVLHAQWLKVLLTNHEKR